MKSEHSRLIEEETEKRVKRLLDPLDKALSNVYTRIAGSIIAMILGFVISKAALLAQENNSTLFASILAILSGIAFFFLTGYLNKNSQEPTRFYRYIFSPVFTGLIFGNFAWQFYFKNHGSDGFAAVIVGLAVAICIMSTAYALEKQAGRKKITELE